jgi:hypothetical protein
MKHSVGIISLGMALGLTAMAQTPPVQTTTPPPPVQEQQPPPPPPPPPAEEQRSHVVAKGMAFGAAANATGGSTTVVHTGNKHHTGSANRQAPAQHQKAKKGRR